MDPRVEAANKTTIVETIIEATDSINKEVQAAQANPLLMNILISKLRQDLKYAESPAKEFIENDKKVSRGEALPIKQGEAAFALRTVIRAVEAAKKGIVVSKTTQGQEILVKLAKESYTSFSVASAIEANLADYLIGNKNITVSTQAGAKSDFEHAFDNLKTDSITAAKLIGPIIINLAKDGEIPGLTEDMAKDKFEVKEEELKRRTVRGEEELTPEDYKNLNGLKDEIHKKIDQALLRNQKLPPKDPNIFTGNEGSLIEEFLWGNTGVNQQTLRTVFQKLGVRPDFIEEYSILLNKILNRPSGERGIISPFLTDQYLKPYILQALDDFNIQGDEFKNKFLKREDGKIIFDRELRLRFKKMITRYYNHALSRVHGDPSRQFDEAMGQFVQTQYYLGDLHGVISNSCNELKNIFYDNKDALAFFSDIESAYQARIMSYARLFHNLPLYARDAASFEKWPEFLGYLFPSELGEVFDPDDRFMEMARDEITLYIRRRLVANGNKYPHDLLGGNYEKQGVRYGLRFQEDVKDILRRRKDRLGMEVEEWEIERAMVYASGIGLASLVDIETMSTSDPLWGNDFKGIHPLMPKLSAKHNWGKGRGYPGAGLKPAKYLLNMDVELFPEQRGFFSRLFNKKRWVPAKFADEVDKQLVYSQERILGELFDRDGKYQELLNMVNIAASLISRGGWRVAPVFEELKAIFKRENPSLDPGTAWKDWTPVEWKKLFDMSLVNYGTGSLWWFLTAGPGRIDSYMKRLLASDLGVDKADEQFDAYSSGEKALEKDFKIVIRDAGGEHEMKANFLEIKQWQMYQLRGETFYRYLRRNPGDFFLQLCQMVPEVAEESGDIFKTKGDLEREYLHHADPGKRKTQYDVEKILERQSQLRKRWGKYFDVIKEVNQWAKNNVGSDKKFKNMNEFISKLTEISTTASEKLKNETSQISRQIEDLENQKEKAADESAKNNIQKQIDALNERKIKRLYVNREDFESNDDRDQNGKFIANMIFDNQNGLLRILTGKNPDQLDNGNLGYSENFGAHDRINMDNLFYTMGQAWTLKEGDINPFAADFNHFALYKNLGQVGEDVMRRYVGDAVAVSKVIENLSHLDHLLLEATEEGNFEEIYKLHTELFNTLQGIISKEYAWRANNILASVVTQFFLEHNITRNVPLKYLLLNFPAKLLLGKKVALSKLLTGNWFAYTMDENAMRSYFRKLSFDKHVLPHEGAWSYKQLEQSFDAKTDTFIFGDVTPTVSWFIFGFLMWVYIKKAIEETEGKKK